MKRKIEDLTDKEVIHCSTEQEAEAICKLMHEAGMKWWAGNSNLRDTYWKKYKGCTCYSPVRGKWGNRGFYESIGCTIHPASDFLPPHVYQGVPIYFAVKIEDSKEWREYIKWINKTFGIDWEGNSQVYYGYDGNIDSIYGVNCCAYVKSLKNNPVLFESPKEFMNIINKNNINKENRFPFLLKAEDAQKIVNIACPGAGNWKEKLVKKWAETIVLGGVIEISEYSYKEMRKACTADQHKLFDEIFGKDIEDKNAFVKEFDGTHIVSLSEELFGVSRIFPIADSSEDSVDRSDLIKRSFYVLSSFQVSLHELQKGGTVIEITKK